MTRYLHRSCGGRIVARDNLHLTLVFLGAVRPEQIPSLKMIGAQQSGATFNLEFGVTGYWKHHRIVWAAPRMSQPLFDFVAALQAALLGAGFSVDHRPHVPHVTLIRDAAKPIELPPLAFNWAIKDFVLVESSSGTGKTEYCLLARWAH